MHRVRILAKRLRYASEALREVLPTRRANRWHELALDLPVGREVDVFLAGIFAERLLPGKG